MVCRIIVMLLSHFNIKLINDKINELTAHDTVTSVMVSFICIKLITHTILTMNFL